MNDNLWARRGHERHRELYDEAYAEQLERIARIRSEVSAALPHAPPPPPPSPPEPASPPGRAAPRWDAAPTNLAPPLRRAATTPRRDDPPPPPAVAPATLLPRDDAPSPPPPDVPATLRRVWLQPTPTADAHRGRCRRAAGRRGARRGPRPAPARRGVARRAGGAHRAIDTSCGGGRAAGAPAGPLRSPSPWPRRAGQRCSPRERRRPRRRPSSVCLASRQGSPRPAAASGWRGRRPERSGCWTGPRVVLPRRRCGSAEVLRGWRSTGASRGSPTPSAEGSSARRWRAGALYGDCPPGPTWRTSRSPPAPCGPPARPTGRSASAIPTGDARSCTWARGPSRSPPTSAGSWPPTPPAR